MPKRPIIRYVGGNLDGDQERADRDASPDPFVCCELFAADTTPGQAAVYDYKETVMEKGQACWIYQFREIIRAEDIVDYMLTREDSSGLR
jgi:hypothetical protein